MKTRHPHRAEVSSSEFKIRWFALIALFSVSQATHAQEAATDTLILQTLRENHAELMPLLQRQIEAAEKQASDVSKQLNRMGDPATVRLNADALEMIKEDMLQSANVLKTKQQKREVYESLTGAEVFDDDADGLLEAIGSTVTLDDGSEAERDPEKYKLEAAFMTQIKEYKEIREQAIEQQKRLSTELAMIMEELETAQDFATVQKLNATISVINSQIDDWNQKVIMARADVDMVEKEFQSTSRLISLGKSEENEMKSKAKEEASAAKTATFPGFGTAPKKLPWGRKGSEGNPGTGSVDP